MRGHIERIVYLGELAALHAHAREEEMSVRADVTAIETEACRLPGKPASAVEISLLERNPRHRA